MAFALSLVGAAPVAAQQADEVATAAEIAALLRLDEVIAIMREEGIGYGADLEAEMFPGQGGARWRETVARIYDLERMQSRFIDSFTAELDGAAETGEIAAFFGSAQGQQIVSLELSARRAMLDEAVDAQSRDHFYELLAEESPRLDLIDRFVTANDLVEQNVTGALNSNLAFYYGMVEADAIGFDMSETDILADVWSQEPVIREETGEWLYSYLALAYQPLEDAALEDYIAFSEGAAGRRLNRALFTAFDGLFTMISRDLGVATGRFVSSQDI
ncbi:hypothetical protein ACFQXB_12120 [Plastorhodobacter daqingensis]|uniref:DUF2059 domain-containing protein n=1 Tax=Plastorhodobacter daqingensis TaxID=1387281 RepID=A0ABW2UJQ4_9RHOB